jgi:trimeric autotransporter adhesin
MIGSGTSRALLVAVGCLLLASCGAAKSSSAPAGANPAAISSVATPASSSTATSSVATSAATAAAVAAGASGMTACGLVTEQDASAALGRAAGQGTAGGTAALSECIYDQGSLIVSMKTDSKALYDNAHAQAHAKGASEVPGIGDSAFQYSTGTAFSGVQFLKGTTLVTVLAGGAGAGDAALAAAKIAASKL